MSIRVSFTTTSKFIVNYFHSYSSVIIFKTGTFTLLKISNIRDRVSDRNNEMMRPSTSDGAYQTVTTKGEGSKMKEIKKSPKKCNKHSPQSSSREKHRSADKSVSSVSELSAQSRDLTISENEGSNPNAPNNLVSKKKNAKKKRNLKMLLMSQAANQPDIMAPQTAPIPQTLERYSLQHASQSLQEQFKNQIVPLYPTASASAKHLENVPPNLKYPQNMQVNQQLQHGQHAISAPNTPIASSSIIDNNSSPLAFLLRSEPTTPKFLQNVLYHPLLNHSFTMNSHQQIEQRMINASLVTNSFSGSVSLRHKENNGHKKHGKGKETPQVDNKFDEYTSQNELKHGLETNIYLEGVLRINPKQFQHSYVSSSSDRSGQDIFIDGIKYRNRALEGDVVIVQLLLDTDDENKDKQRKGKVVFIKEKIHPRTCIGNLKLMPDNNRQKAIFIPRDHRIPRLNIPFTCWPDNFYQDAKSYESTLFLAEITEWNDTRFAIGKIVCNIGQSGDMLTESKAILLQNDLDVTPYGPEYRHLYPRLDYTIPEEEIELREDCRKICLFSIDPFNCRDIDDAVSCRELDNGNYEIGVHIADVTHFLTENTKLDEKVAEKATTIYLVERAYHMLPDELCMLCSLFPGVDKLAFSVFWEITPDAEVLSWRFAKTVINSCCQLAYDHCQDILDGKEDAESKFPEFYNGFQYSDVYNTIKVLGKISSTLRKNRFDSGALRIDQPKVAFHLNTTDGLPKSFWIYESKESHQLIEEFMLLANMTVAKKIYDDQPTLAFLRCHPPPSSFMMRQLVSTLQPVGIELDISSAGNLHKSLLTHAGNDADKGKAMVLNMLCAKPMTRAKYFCANGCKFENFNHYALNVPLYTHFTSPIRRYADIMVHRLLAACLNYTNKPNWEVDKVRAIAAQCNKQKYNAKKAGEMSTELYTLKYIEMHSPIITDAVVVEVKDKYIDVIIVEMGLNRRIFFNNDFPGEYKCVKSEAGARLSKMVVTWRSTDEAAAAAATTVSSFEQVIQVFSVIKVEMHKVDEIIKIETKLARPVVT